MKIQLPHPAITVFYCLLAIIMAYVLGIGRVTSAEAIAALVILGIGCLVIALT